MTGQENCIAGLNYYIEHGVSPFHVVETAVRELEKAGYRELSLTDSWSLERGNGYFVRAHGSSLFAFRINPGFKRLQSFRVAAAHTDWPCLRIKPNPDMKSEEMNKLNVEVYGGPILNTWLDRPLSIAGRVTLKGESVFSPETVLVDFARTVATIPNLAIHMNREVNKGIELNRQIDLLPLVGQPSDSKDEEKQLKVQLGRELSRDPEDILFYELSLYNTDRPERVGFDREFLSAPRLDNITSVKAGVEGLIQGSGRRKGCDMIALFDHEEIGSRTKQGAGSMLLSVIHEKICKAFDYSDEDCINSALKSFFLSVDVGHAKHPNQTGKSDPTHSVIMNRGVVLKTDSNQHYTTDGEAIGVIRSLCEEHDIPYQMFANRSDNPGGSTLGAIASSFTVMNTVDIGVPLLAMHSARETMGVLDQEALEKLITHYFKEV